MGCLLNYFFASFHLRPYRQFICWSWTLEILRNFQTNDGRKISKAYDVYFTQFPKITFSFIFHPIPLIYGLLDRLIYVRYLKLSNFPRFCFIFWTWWFKFINVCITCQFSFIFSRVFSWSAYNFPFIRALIETLICRSAKVEKVFFPEWLSKYWVTSTWYRFQSIIWMVFVLNDTWFFFSHGLIKTPFYVIFSRSVPVF